MSTSFKGNTAVRESWESRTKTKAVTDSLELIKKGKYADLEALIPVYGAELITGYTVVSAVLSPGRGTMGTLTISLTEKDGSSVGTVPVGAISCLIETDMAQLEKPLLTHPMFTDEASSVAQHIELWKSEPDAGLRSQYKYTDTDGSTIVDLAGLDLTAAKLILSGTESYLDFVPVVTRTTTYKARKDPENIGKKDTPPVTVPGTWEYLKTTDRCIQQADKNYSRTEQWTGSKKVNTDLYETA